MEAYQPAISFHSSGQYEIAVAAMATGEVNKGFGSRRERGGQKQVEQNLLQIVLGFLFDFNILIFEFSY